jgi:hypothetical protein
MPGILQEDIAILRPLMSERFSRSGVASSLSNVQMNVYETEATGSKLLIQGIPLPFAGSLVGLSAALSAAATLGTLTLTVTVNGVVTNCQIVITTATSGYLIQEYGSALFNAGDKLGVQITTNAAWNATTADLLVEVYVVFGDARF